MIRQCFPFFLYLVFVFSPRHRLTLPETGGTQHSQEGLWHPLLISFSISLVLILKVVRGGVAGPEKAYEEALD